MNLENEIFVLSAMSANECIEMSTSYALNKCNKFIKCKGFECTECMKCIKCN